jgi:hypothetical protein
MKNLRRLGLSITLLCILSTAAFAGETNSPPCTPPDPGETNSPPCSVTQIVSDDSIPQTQAVSTVFSNDLSVGDMTLDLVKTMLSLF